MDEIKKEKDVFKKSKLILQLLKEKNLKIVDLAKQLGYQSSYLCHLKRLQRIPEMIIDGYYSKMIFSSHLFVLSRIKDRKKMIELYEKILTDSLTVNQTEALVRESLYQIKSKGKYLTDEQKQPLVEKIKNKYPEIDIKIIQTRIKGRVVFEVKGNLEETSKTIKKLLNFLSDNF
jgi:ParB family chromosome partitioning protein